MSRTDLPLEALKEPRTILVSDLFAVCETASNVPSWFYPATKLAAEAVGSKPALTNSRRYSPGGRGMRPQLREADERAVAP